MGKKLEELSKFVSEHFTEAGQSAESVKRVAEMERLINEAKEEDKALLDSNAELVKSYRELVNSTAGSKKEERDPIKDDRKEIPSFDDALNNWGKGLDIFGEKLREKEN